MTEQEQKVINELANNGEGDILATYMDTVMAKHQGKCIDDDKKTDVDFKGLRVARGIIQEITALLRKEGRLKSNLQPEDYS